jgi:hypothetical protein
MVLMPPLQRLALAGLVLLTACHLEDHTPEGSRRDEAQIREVIAEYYRGFTAQDWATCRRFFAPGAIVTYPAKATGDSVAGTVIVPADSIFLSWARLEEAGTFPSPQARIVRADLRQVGSVAAVWVSVRQTLPVAFESQPAGIEIEDVEHWVLHRTSEGWRVAVLTLPWTPR